MTDNDLETMYKSNVGTSHFAGLRGVFDAGYAAALNDTIQQAQSTDGSSTVTDPTALADTPPVTQP